ncbi:hypothetical protein GGF50DRAFT_120706 [Schizophyllum commune]
MSSGPNVAPVLEPAVTAAVIDAAHSVDLFLLISPPQNPAALTSIMEGPDGFNTTFWNSGTTASVLILERALFIAFLERKLAREEKFRRDLSLLICANQIPAILFNFPGAPNSSEKARAALFYAYLGLMFSLRPEATEKALEKIYLRLVEAAIAAHEPSPEDPEKEEEMARALRFALDYLDVLNSSEEEREVALSSAAGLSVSMLKHLVDTAVKDVEEAVERERAARAAASSQGSCSVM